MLKLKLRKKSVLLSKIKSLDLQVMVVLMPLEVKHHSDLILKLSLLLMNIKVGMGAAAHLNSTQLS